MFDMEDILDSISDNPKAVSDLGRIKLGEFFRSYGLNVPPAYTLPFSGRPPSEMKSFLKNAMGKPYLAGSTFKGALRTALWSTLDRSRLPSSSADFRRFENEVGKLHGRPHDDFLRPLSVSDSAPVEPDGALQAREIKFFNTLAGNRPGWKDFSSKRNLDRFENTTGVFVEALRPETRLYLRMEIDGFLRKEPMRSLWPIPASKGLDDFSQLAGVVNAHSLKLARSEMEFFSRFGPATSRVAAFYSQLINGGFDQVKTMPGAFLFRMAWGSGWKGMTGDWLDDRDLENVRRQKKLGKRDVPIFPKTRRLAMADGVPSLPLGWALAQKTPDRVFLEKASAALVPIVVFSPEAPREKKQEPVEKPAGTQGAKTQPVTQVPPEKQPPAAETWEKAHLKWTPNDDMVTATDTASKRKAMVKGKELVPDKYKNKMIKQRKAVTATVVVEPLGNLFRIIDIQ